MNEGIPSSLVGNDLRRIADALEALVYLKQKEADFKEKDFHGERKDPHIWITCRAELIRLLEERPFIDWETAKGNDVFRDPKVGNMYRLHQWQRFLDHHAIPNKPDDGTKVVIVAWGKTDKHVCSPQCLSAARDACRRIYLHGLQRGSWSTMMLAKRALEYLSQPVENTGRIAPVPQSLDAGSDLRRFPFQNDGVDFITR